MTVTVPASGHALVTVTALGTNSANEQSALMGFEVSGASTVAASDTRAMIVPFYGSGANLKVQTSATYLVTGLTAGSNTFTAKYRPTGGTGTWANRSIIVIPLA